MPRRSASGELEIAGVPVAAIAAEFGTPSTSSIRRMPVGRATAIREHFEREFGRIGAAVQVYYAGKAFLSTEVARWMAGGRSEHRRRVGRRAGRRSRCGSGSRSARPARQQQERCGTRPCGRRRGRHDRAGQRRRGGPGRSGGCAARGPSARAPAHQLRRARPTHEYLATAREDQKFGIPIADAPAVVAEIRTHPELEFRGAALPHRLADLRVRRIRRGGAKALRPARAAARRRSCP